MSLANESKPTQGQWDFACDSYGKVQHSRKACVYSSVSTPNGDCLVTIAARIPNWDDACLIASAPDLLAALKGALPFMANGAAYTAAKAAIEKAEGLTRYHKGPR